MAPPTLSYPLLFPIGEVVTQLFCHHPLRTGTQIKLLASEMIPKEFYTYFGSHMSSDHGRSHFSPIAKWGSNNFFSKY